MLQKSNEYESVSRMAVYNSSHLRWEQVQCDLSNLTSATTVLDSFWLVQSNHGSFSTQAPTLLPTKTPTTRPTIIPTASPSATLRTTRAPTVIPTVPRTKSPTAKPTKSSPTPK
mmetsp:Transcript_521/g.771  ORF Transcript_521/g.771 Transcript_521/m.771 type:complete len:114 (-) Transcript_521:261-602(-)